MRSDFSLNTVYKATALQQDENKNRENYLILQTSQAECGVVYVYRR